MTSKAEKINKILKRLTSRQKKLLVTLVLVLIVVIAFEIAFGVFASRSHALRTENASMRSKLTDYTILINQKQDIIDEIDRLNKNTDDIIGKYSAGNSPEKTLVFLDKLSKVSGMNIPSVSFGQDTLVSAGTDAVGNNENQLDDTSKDDGNINIIEGGTDLYLYNYQVSFAYVVPYTGLKKALNYIGTNDERMTVENISAAYDAGTGYVSGSITLNQYALVGGGLNREYKSPIVNGKEKGASNLFG